MKFMFLNLSNISVNYAGQSSPAVNQVSFGLPAGDIGVLIGPSGCGKTTLLRAGHAYLLIGIVLCVIAFFVERRERLGFLQEVLVAIKTEELAQLNDHLSAMASKDGLSGLANRRAFDEFLAREWERGRREEQPLW